MSGIIPIAVFLVVGRQDNQWPERLLSLQPFVESGLWDPTLNGFPESRPEATDRAEKSGTSMGVETKPSGNRPGQPISDRFFYWLRATMPRQRWWLKSPL